MQQGFFITFEGGEGVGKTTQIQKLSEELSALGHDVIVTREPGGTPHAEAIRNLLSDPELGPHWLPKAEAMLISAARLMHVQDVIRPALSNGKIVISDRFIDSTQVYQGIVHQVADDFLSTLNAHSAKDIAPNLTFILDLNPEEGLKRVRARGVRDHYDEQGADFYEQIRQGFLKIAQDNPDRCEVIDASSSIDDIANDILTKTKEKLNV